MLEQKSIKEYIKPYGTNFLIYIHAITNTSSNKTGEIIYDQYNNAYLKLYVTAVREKGQANQAILELLADILDIRKSQLSLFTGQTSQKKIFLLSNK